jgi:hypothetical protein
MSKCDISYPTCSIYTGRLLGYFILIASWYVNEHGCNIIPALHCIIILIRNDTVVFYTQHRIGYQFYPIVGHILQIEPSIDILSVHTSGWMCVCN